MAIDAQPLRFPLWAKITTAAIVSTLFLLLLRGMGGLLSPFLWAMVTAYLFNPLIRWLTNRTRLPRFWWVLLLYVVVGFLLFTAFTSLGPRVANQAAELQAALPVFVRDASEWIKQNGTLSFGSREIDLRPAEADVIEWFAGLASTLSSNVPTLIFNVLEQLILALVFLVVTFYLLLQGERIIDSIYNLVPAPYRQEIRTLGHSIDRVLGAYIRSQIILIVLMSVLTWASLSVLGVQYALVIGIATGFLEVIPFVGPYTAAGIAIFVSLLQATTPFGWPNWVLGIVVGVLYLVLRQLEDHLIIPNLVGHIVELHPIIVIFAILAGGHLGGALGLLIAIPVAATIRIILVYLYQKLIDSPTVLAEVRAETDELLDQTGPPSRNAALSTEPHAEPTRRSDRKDEPATR